MLLSTWFRIDVVDASDRGSLELLPSREQVIKAALHKILNNEAEVERIFLIVKAQRDY